MIVTVCGSNSALFFLCDSSAAESEEMGPYTTILGVGGGYGTHNKIRGVGVDPYKSILAHSQGSQNLPAAVDLLSDVFYLERAAGVSRTSYRRSPKQAAVQVQAAAL